MQLLNVKFNIHRFFHCAPTALQIKQSQIWKIYYGSLAIM